MAIPSLLNIITEGSYVNMCCHHHSRYSPLDMRTLVNYWQSHRKADMAAQEHSFCPLLQTSKMTEKWELEMYLTNGEYFCQNYTKERKSIRGHWSMMFNLHAAHNGLSLCLSLHSYSSNNMSHILAPATFKVQQISNISLLVNATNADA